MVLDNHRMGIAMRSWRRAFLFAVAGGLVPLAAGCKSTPGHVMPAGFEALKIGSTVTEDLIGTLGSLPGAPKSVQVELSLGPKMGTTTSLTLGSSDTLDALRNVRDELAKKKADFMPGLMAKADEMVQRGQFSSADRDKIIEKAQKADHEVVLRVGRSLGFESIWFFLTGPHDAATERLAGARFRLPGTDLAPYIAQARKKFGSKFTDEKTSETGCKPGRKVSWEVCDQLTAYHLELKSCGDATTDGISLLLVELHKNRCAPKASEKPAAAQPSPAPPKL
jgi:hypothetical protein